MDEHVDMVAADDRRVRSGGPKGDEMDEDEEGAGPQVQCAKFVIFLSPSLPFALAFSSSHSE